MESKKQEVGGSLVSKDFLSNKPEFKIDFQSVRQNLLLARDLGFGNSDGGKKFGVEYPLKLAKKEFRSRLDGQRTIPELLNSLQEAENNPSSSLVDWGNIETSAYLHILESMRGVLDPSTRKAAGRVAAELDNSLVTTFRHHLLYEPNAMRNPFTFEKEVQPRRTSLSVDSKKAFVFSVPVLTLLAGCGLTPATQVVASPEIQTTRPTIVAITSEQSATPTSEPTETPAPITSFQDLLNIKSIPVTYDGEKQIGLPDVYNSVKDAFAAIQKGKNGRPQGECMVYSFWPGRQEAWNEAVVNFLAANPQIDYSKTENTFGGATRTYDNKGWCFVEFIPKSTGKGGYLVYEAIGDHGPETKYVEFKGPIGFGPEDAVDGLYPPPQG